MTERALTHARRAIAGVLLALPAYLLFEAATSCHLRLGEAALGALVVTPWLLAGLGLLFRVAVARGLAIGLGIWAMLGYAFGQGASMPEEPMAFLLLAQTSAVLLALPAFSRVFADGLRLRWTAMAFGLAVPVAAVFAVISSGAASVVAYLALGLVGFAAVGLARQKTWALFAVLGAATSFCVAGALTVEPSMSYFGPPPEGGYIAAAALASMLLPWLAPAARQLRGPGRPD